MLVIDRVVRSIASESEEALSVEARDYLVGEFVYYTPTSFEPLVISRVQRWAKALRQRSLVPRAEVLEALAEELTAYSAPDA